MPTYNNYAAKEIVEKIGLVGSVKKSSAVVTTGLLIAS